MIKVCAVTGNPHQQIRIFFRMMIGVQQYFPVDHIGLKLHAAFLKVCAEDTG